MHDRAVGEREAGTVSRVVSGSLKLLALFAPDKDDANLCLQFLRWSYGY
jgi:hypothetical protein